MSLTTSLRWAIVAATCLATIGGISPVYAQTEESPPAQFCSVLGSEADSAGLRTVRASCFGTGLELGQAEFFEAFTNPALDATVVALVRSNKLRVLLLRRQADGSPIIEDMEAALAEAAGRGPLGGIEGLPIDFEQFAANGTLGVGAPVDDGVEAGSGEELLSEDGLAQGQSDLSDEQSVVIGEPAVIIPGQINIGAFIQNDPAGAAAQSDQ